MLDTELEALRSRFEALRSDKTPIVAVWDQIETYVMPLTGKDSARQQTAPNQTTDDVVWDLTAPLAAEHLAASLHGNVTSPASRWVDFEWDELELEKDQAAVRHREALAQVVWSALQASDFNSEIAAGYNEHASLGNMVLMCEPLDPNEWKGLDFTSIPDREAFLEEDALGGIYRAFRLLRWSAVQCLDKFGEGTPEEIKKKAALPTGGTTKLDVVFAVFRRKDIPEWTPTGDVKSDLLPVEKRPFGGVYFTLEGCLQLGDDLGFYEMPIVHARWNRMPGSIWGFGRGHLALRNVKFLNGYKELARAQAACAVAPRMVATQRGIESTVNLGPGGVTVGDPADVKVIESTGRFDVSAEVIQDERMEIRRAFHEDDLQLKESPAMTATEVQARRDMMDRVLGSPVGRLQTEALVPVVFLVLRLLYRAGKLPAAPQSVKAKKAELRVKFRGPIARAQAMDQVVAIERSAAFISNLFKLGFEESKYYFDVGAAVREHSRLLGVPATILRSEDEAKKLKDVDMQAARAAMAAETAKNAAQAGKAGAEAATMMAGGGGGAAPAGGAVLPFAPQAALVPSGAQLP